ncbi:MAG: HEAT repeat domain-containing protein [Planctomycetota bacterium]
MKFLQGPLLAAVALLLLVAPAEAVDWEPPQEKKAIEKEIKRTVKEWDQLSGNHDLVPQRRRRELIRRLGYMPHKKSIKALRRILRKEKDTRARINTMVAIVRIGEVKDVEDVYKFCLKEIKPAAPYYKDVYPCYLGYALTYTPLDDVKDWIVEKPLEHSNHVIRLGAIEAIGLLKHKLAVPRLIEIHDRAAAKTGREGTTIRYESLRALGRIGGEQSEALLLTAGKDKDWRIRLAVCETLLDHARSEEALKMMRALFKEDSQILREACAQAVGRNKVEALFPELVLTMREGNLRAKSAAYESLKLVTGQDFKLAPDVWEKWWRDKKKGKLTDEGKFAKGERISVSTYYNFKIFSDHVLFVVDISGSMKWLEAPPQRIDVAKKQLVNVVRSLDPKTNFNLMTFASDMHTWNKQGGVPATKENIDKALVWIDKRFLPRGGTNTHGAIMEALYNNPKVDTVYFLSDGLPSSGSMEVQEEIIVALRDANRFRKVVFNTIALVFGKSRIEKAHKYEDPQEMGAFMERIAEVTGGQSVVIDRPFFDLDD